MAAQLLPHLYIVELDHKAVYFVREVLPFLPLFLNVICNSLGISGREKRGPAVHLEPQLPKTVKHLPMGGRRIFLREESFVDKAVQRYLTSLGALLSPERAGCQVAGICIGDIKTVIHQGESLKRQIDLSPDCKVHRLRKLKRYASHSLHIGSDIVAHKAVSTGGSLNQKTIPVGQDYGDSVNLLLGYELCPAAVLLCLGHPVHKLIL